MQADIKYFFLYKSLTKCICLAGYYVVEFLFTFLLDNEVLNETIKSVCELGECCFFKEIQFASMS